MQIDGDGGQEHPDRVRNPQQPAAKPPRPYRSSHACACVASRPSGMTTKPTAVQIRNSSQPSRTRRAGSGDSGRGEGEGLSNLPPCKPGAKRRQSRGCKTVPIRSNGTGTRPPMKTRLFLVLFSLRPAARRAGLDARRRNPRRATTPPRRRRLPTRKRTSAPALQPGEWTPFVDPENQIFPSLLLASATIKDPLRDEDTADKADDRQIRARRRSRPPTTPSRPPPPAGSLRRRKRPARRRRWPARQTEPMRASRSRRTR